MVLSFCQMSYNYFFKLMVLYIKEVVFQPPNKTVL